MGLVGQVGKGIGEFEGGIDSPKMRRAMGSEPQREAILGLREEAAAAQAKSPDGTFGLGDLSERVRAAAEALIPRWLQDGEVYQPQQGRFRFTGGAVA